MGKASIERTGAWTFCALIFAMLFFVETRLWFVKKVNILKC